MIHGIANRYVHVTRTPANYPFRTLSCSDGLNVVAKYLSTICRLDMVKKERIIRSCKVCRPT